MVTYTYLVWNAGTMSAPKFTLAVYDDEGTEVYRVSGFATYADADAARLESEYADAVEVED